MKGKAVIVAAKGLNYEIGDDEGRHYGSYEDPWIAIRTDSGMTVWLSPAPARHADAGNVVVLPEQKAGTLRAG